MIKSLFIWFVNPQELLFKQHLMSKGVDVSKPNNNPLFKIPVLIFKSMCETHYENGVEI